MGLSQNITCLRKNFGMTQEKLAEKCEVSRQAVTKWESGESEPSIDKLIILSEIFSISIDELVKNEKPNDLKFFNYGEGLGYSMTKTCINELYQNELFNAQTGGVIRYELLKLLLGQIKHTFIDVIGNVRDRYLLCNTTEKERSTCLYPFTCGKNDTMESKLADEYVKGNCEIDVFFDRIQSEYEKLIEESFDIGDMKLENSQIIDMYFIVSNSAHVLDENDFSEIFREKYMKNIRNLLKENKRDTLIERFLLFFASEVENAVQTGDDNLVYEISSDLKMLKDYVWYKIPLE